MAVSQSEVLDLHVLVMDKDTHDTVDKAAKSLGAPSSTSPRAKENSLEPNSKTERTPSNAPTPDASTKKSSLKFKISPDWKEKGPEAYGRTLTIVGAPRPPKQPKQPKSP